MYSGDAPEWTRWDKVEWVLTKWFGAPPDQLHDVLDTEKGTYEFLSRLITPIGWFALLILLASMWFHHVNKPVLEAFYTYAIAMTIVMPIFVFVVKVVSLLDGRERRNGP